MKVPAGAKLITRYTYDNSKRNPANPDSNRVVPWGDQSFDEMMFTAIRYRWIEETVANQTNFDTVLNSGQFLGMIDDNVDGMIQLAELKGELGRSLRAMFPLVDTNKDGAIDSKELTPLLPRIGGGSLFGLGG